MLSCLPSKRPDLLIALGGDSQGSYLTTTFLTLRKLAAFANHLCRARAHLFQLCRVGEAGTACRRERALSPIHFNCCGIFLFVQLCNSLFHTVHWQGDAPAGVNCGSCGSLRLHLKKAAVKATLQNFSLLWAGWMPAVNQPTWTDA